MRKRRRCEYVASAYVEGVHVNGRGEQVDQAFQRMGGFWSPGAAKGSRGNRVGDDGLS